MLRTLRLINAAAFILLFFLAGSGIASTNKTTDSKLFKIELRPEPSEPVVGTNAVLLAITDARSNAPVDGAAIEVIPWMTMHGHGSPKKPAVKPLGSGRYKVENIFYTMEGDWDLMVNIAYKGASDTVTFSISNVKRK